MLPVVPGKGEKGIEDKSQGANLLHLRRKDIFSLGGTLK